MPNLTMSIPHQLPRAEARQRVEELVVRLQQQLGGQVGQVSEQWTGDTLTFNAKVMAMPLSGTVAVEDQAIQVTIALPWQLSMLSNTVKQHIEQESQKLLGQR